MSNDLKYRPSWICKIFGHKPRLTVGTYHRELDYCKRCFLPTSQWLVQELKRLKPALKEQVRQELLEERTPEEIDA